MPNRSEPPANKVAQNFSVEEHGELVCALLHDPERFDAALECRFGNVSSEVAVYGLLKLYSDDEPSRSLWQALTERGPTDRDAVVLALWRRLEATAQDYVASTYRSLTYHRHRLFEWFLGRYDLRRARSVWTSGWWTRNAHLLLLGLLLVTAALRVGMWSRGEPGPFLARPQVLAVVGSYTLVTLLLARAFRPPRTAGKLEAGSVALQSLSPRLAAAAAAGVVVLASSGDLLGFVVEGARWSRLVLVVALAYAYLLVEMSRRVQPVPRLRRLLGHGADIAATAFAHGLALALLAEPALRTIARDLEPWSLIPLLNVAAFLFAIGLIVNLVWAEQPVTQPL